MPLEPPPTSWTLTRPPAAHPQDAWAIGADLEPGTLLAAYRTGIFPMRMEGDLIWWSPARRAVIPVEGHTRSRSLRRAARGFEIRVDTAFAAVIRGCADPSRPHGWLDEGFVAAYTRLHELGWAHSVEAWDAQGLAGGPRLLDVQWSTPHLATLGAIEITRGEYHRRLDIALRLPDAWGEPCTSSRGLPR